jgi:hypothetical protein
MRSATSLTSRATCTIWCVLASVALGLLCGCGGTSKTVAVTRTTVHTVISTSTSTRSASASTKTQRSTASNAALGWNAPPIRHALQRFAACMRDHHIDLPPPNTSGKGQLFSERHLNMASPDFARAYKTCLPLAPPGF